jgi:RimJ/RimL family protein N-acetyltransferase
MSPAVSETPGNPRPGGGPEPRRPRLGSPGQGKGAGPAAAEVRPSERSSFAESLARPAYDQAMAHRSWPIADLRLSVGALELRPLTEADLPTLVSVLPDDVELNPASTIFPGAPLEAMRGTIVHQDYWRAMGTWSPDAWRLNFGVWHEDELIGAQELEGNDFARLRTVDTASFLAPAYRGRGLGKAMRRAVLSLAFGPLAAEVAITSAWHDNHASLAVSRSLGYVDNGIEVHRRDNGVDDMVHLRLTRAAWLASPGAAGVEIEAIDPCLPYFGLI